MSAEKEWFSKHFAVICFLELSSSKLLDISPLLQLYIFTQYQFFLYFFSAQLLIEYFYKPHIYFQIPFKNTYWNFSIYRNFKGLSPFLA